MSRIIAGADHHLFTNRSTFLQTLHDVAALEFKCFGSQSQCLNFFAQRMEDAHACRRAKDAALCLDQARAWHVRAEVAGQP